MKISFAKLRRFGARSILVYTMLVADPAQFGATPARRPS
jgi:hypothetical protein